MHLARKGSCDDERSREVVRRALFLAHFQLFYEIQFIRWIYALQLHLKFVNLTDSPFSTYLFLLLQFVKWLNFLFVILNCSRVSVSSLLVEVSIVGIS